jgi:hypothetical protein
LAAACEKPHDPAVPALFHTADAATAALEHHPIASFQPVGLLLRAGAAAARGNREASVALLDEAARRFDLFEMRLHAAVARRRRGGLVGGDEGRTDVQRAEQWMALQGIADPEGISRMLAPGFRS